MDYRQLIVETISKRTDHPPLSHPALEPEVVRIEGLGSLSVISGHDGRATLIAHSERVRNDWGTAHQRTWHIDPDDLAATVGAINEAYDALM